MLKSRGLTGTLLVAVAALVIGLAFAGGSSAPTTAQAANPDVLSIFNNYPAGTCTAASAPSCTGQIQTDITVPVSSTFHAQVNATTLSGPHAGYAWEIVWTLGILTAGPATELDTDLAATNCVAQPSGTPGTISSPPLDGAYGGCVAATAILTTTEPLTDLPLTCAALGSTQVALYDALTDDTTLGSTYLNAGGVVVPTDTAPKVPGTLPGGPNPVAAFTVHCVASVDVSIVKNSTGMANVGSTGTYTLLISNPDAANAHSVDVSDTAPAGITFTGVDNGCAFTASTVTCTGLSIPAAGSVTVTVQTTANTCGSKSNTATAVLSASEALLAADPNPANNSSTKNHSVDCPVLTVTKTPSATAVFTGNNVTYTIVVANDPGSSASVTLTDPLGGATFVALGSDADCAGTTTVTCGPRTVAGGSSTTFVIVAQMPQSSGTVCDTATATATGAQPASSAQVCVAVNPAANGFVKDTDLGTPGFQSNSNIWICKTTLPNGQPWTSSSNLPANQPACNTLKVAELLFFTQDKDTCNDDDDGDGKPCAGVPNTAPLPFQDPQDGCALAPGTENYIPGVTKVDCNGGEVGEGLGAFEFQIKYDHKLFQQPAIDCNGILGSTGRAVQTAVTVVTENWTLFGCVSKNGVGGTKQGGGQLVPQLPLVGAPTCTTDFITFSVTCAFRSETLSGSLNGTFAGTTPGGDGLKTDCGGPAIGQPCAVTSNGTTGTMTLNLGSGNTLVGTYAGVFQPLSTSTGIEVGNFTVTGGTGCGTSAVGQVIHMTQNVTFNLGTGAIAFTGTYGSSTFWPVGLCGAPMLGGVLAPNGTAATVTLTLQPDLFSRIRPTKDNGVVTDILDENCEIADIFGMPFFGTVQGGLTPDCKDATLTIRMLEGDVDLNCKVDIADDQAMAYRYGAFFGNLLYNRFYDLEPNIAPDFDVDIKDLQTVFGRNGSTCKNPIPIQNPNPTTPDP